MKVLLFMAGICMPFFLLSQNPIERNIPATPNATALGRYGEVPVSLHTGIPNISVPITNLYSKDLSLPIELSYHAGGIKVEELSSWVGLGWSLMAGGVITRQVRSVPDEEAHSFSTAKPYTNQEVLNLYESSYLNAAIPIQMALDGQLDLEPDIYYFNFANETGQFFYDEVTSKFVGLNNTLKVIQYNNLTGGWIITLNDGTTYYFDDFETSQTGAPPCTGNSGFVKTAWYLSKIENPNKTDVIQFNYQSHSYRFETLYESNKYFVAEPTSSCSVMDFGPGVTHCFQSNEFNSKRLTSIIARSGRVEFLPNSNERLDIDNDYALDKIKIFNASGKLLETFQLNQDYFGPTTPGSPSANYRLRLNSIDRVAEDQMEDYRTFEYSSYELPPRTSYAQDYWGYYNGKLANTGLIPEMVLQTVSGPVVYSGADRYPSTDVMHFEAGMLKKIFYPTSGYSSFEYENHRVNESFVPITELKSDYITSDYYDAKNGDVFSINFTIDELPHSIINGANPNGGAFVNFYVDGILCEYGQTSGYAQTGCAIISLTGPEGFTITQNLTNRYLPNGDYTLTMNFSTNIHGSASWEEFYGLVSWKGLKNQADETSPIGGLRIRRIIDFDPITQSKSYERVFQYTDENNNSLSSAQFWQRPSFQKNVWVQREVSCGNGCTLTYQCSCIVLSANSSYPVAGLMSNVTYGYVTVLEDELGVKGKRTYTFMNPPVTSNTVFPYVPSRSVSWMAGKLMAQADHIFTTNGYRKIREVEYAYSTIPFTETLGIRIVAGFSGGEIHYQNVTDNYFMNGHYIVSPYLLDYNNLMYLSSSITRNFSPENGLVKHETHELSKIDPLYLNVIRKEVSTSDNATLVTHTKYSADYSNTGTDTMSISIGVMKDRNMLTVPIETTLWKKFNSVDSILLEGRLTLFELDNEKILPSKTLYLSSSPSYQGSEIEGNAFTYDDNYEMEYEFVDYDHIGNLLHSKGRSDVSEFLIYDKTKQKVICKGVGGDFSSVFYEGFEDCEIGYSMDSYAGFKSYGQIYNVPGEGNRMVSYWRRRASGDWEFIQVNVSGDYQIGGADELIDEVRIHKQSTQLTTFSYNQWNKIASINDPNNIVIRYEYDDFGRLIFIKDAKGSVIQKFEYHLVGTRP